MLRRPLNILDLFCGAGGTSTGAVEAASALGYDPKLTAINHWPVAVSTHAKNHPSARHLCTGIDNVNPRELYNRGELHILWASPSCTHHSNAAGGMPLNDQLRATGWCVVKIADALLPPLVLIENVPEYRNYGPLKRVRKNGRLIWRPDPDRKGQTFNAILNAMDSIGYDHIDHQVLRAADYGDPTSRRRLFIQFQRRGRKIVWPTPTHGEGRLPWVPAMDIIDWSLPCPSIYKRKWALSPKTMARIWEGLHTFGGAPFVVPQHSTNRTRSVKVPAPTVTTTSRGIGLAQPFLICMEHGGKVRPINLPVPTITTAKGGAIAMAKPFLVKMRGTNNAADLAAPAPTITAGGNHLALCQASLLPQGGGGVMRSVTEPVPTVATDGAIALISPFLVKYYGTGKSASIHEPLDTVTAKDRFALCKPILIEAGGDLYQLDIGFRMLKWPELALAQGFRGDYAFTGTNEEIVAQIGNAVPRRLSRAIVTAAWTQNPDVSSLLTLS